MQQIKPGDLVDGYVFQGGDLSQKNSWRKAAPKPGEELDGYVFKGGDPGLSDSWLKKDAPRGAFGVVNDNMIEVANAAAGGVKAVSDFISPGNRVSKAIEGFIQSGEESQSDQVKASKLQFQNALANAIDAGEEIGAVLDYIADSPLLAVSQAVGSFAVPGAAVKGAGLIAGALGGGQKAVQLAGRAGGVAAGAAMGGGDAAGSAYDAVMDTPTEIISAVPEFASLIEAGKSEDEAKQELATKAARKAAVLPALLGGAFGAVGVEKLLAGAGGYTGGVAARALKGFASEGAQEAVEEGVTQFEGSRAASAYNPEIDPFKGVAGAAAMGAVTGGVMGGGVSAFTSPVDLVSKATTADEAIEAAIAAQDIGITVAPKTNYVPADGNQEATARIEGAAQGVLVEPDPVQQRLENAAAAGARLPANPINKKIGEIQQAIAARGGVATPIEASFLERYGAGKPYDRVATPEELNVPEPRAKLQTPVSDSIFVDSASNSRGAVKVGAAEPSAFQYDQAAQGQKRPEPVPTTRVDSFIEQQRKINTPAAQMLVGQFDRGELTREQIEQDLATKTNIANQRVLTPDPVQARLESAAREGATTTPADGIVIEQGFRRKNPITEKIKAMRDAISERGGEPTEAEASFLKRYETFAPAMVPTSVSVPQTTQSAVGSPEPAQPAAANKDWEVFTPDTGTLNVPRAEMPQVKAENRGAMVNFLNARGVAHQQEEVSADSLKPTQAEFSREKVEKAKQFEGGDRSILVSADGYVVDGHHQWLAKKEKGEPVKAIRLDAPIADLLPLVREFPSSTVDESSAAVDGGASQFVVNNPADGAPQTDLSSADAPQPAARVDQPSSNPAKAPSPENQAPRQEPEQSGTEQVQPAQPTLSAREAQELAEVRRQAEKKEQRKAARAVEKAPMALSVGMMPNSAEPVTVKEGVVFIGDEPAQDFETGDDVIVAEDATPEQIRDALKAAGAVGNRVKFFGLNNAGQDKTKDSGTENPLNESRPETPSQPPLFSRGTGFSEKVDMVLDGTLPESTAIGVARSVPVLTALGMPELPLATTGGRITKMHLDHGMTRAEIAALEKEIQNPVMVFESDTVPGSKVVVTSLWRDGMPIIMAVKPNAELKRIDVNLITSAYPRSNPGKMGDWVRDGLLKYFDKEKASAWATIGRVQFPWMVQLQQRLPVNVIGPDDVVKPSFRRATASRDEAGIAELQQFADSLTAGWANAPEVVVLDSLSDPATPAAVRRQNEVQKSQGASGEPRAFFYDGKVWLVNSQLTGKADAADALFHEALGHFGLRGVFGNTLRPVLNDLASRRPELIQAKAEEYGLDLTTSEGKLTAAEEVLAELAETRPEISFVRMAVAAVRTWLRNNVGFLNGLKLTNDEIVRNFIVPARDWVKKGRDGRPSIYRGNRGRQLSFSRVKSTDTKSFKDWFGGSKVVDAEGKPLVVYHGTRPGNDITQFETPNNRDGIYFTPDASYAEGFSSDLRGDTGEAGPIYPVYLSVKNPYVVRADDIESDEAQKFLYRGLDRSELEKQGYDGAMLYLEGELDQIIAFDSKQVKSATGNRGRFDPADPDIRFSRSTDKERASFKVDEPGRLDNIIYKLQDKNVDLKRVTQAITKQTGELEDTINAYQKESLYHGKAAKQSKDFLDKQLRPLLDEMRMRKVNLQEFENYLWNRHAPERNEQIAKVNDRFPDGGSGIKTEDAMRYLAGLPEDKRRHFEALAKRVDQITRDNMQMMVDSGLEKQSTIDSMKGAYKHYVPLLRGESSSYNGRGQGYSIRGATTKRALGSDKPVENIISALADQREKIISRAQKAEVGRALMGLALENPQDDFWFVFDPLLNKDDGQRTRLRDQLETMGLDADLAEEISRQPYTEEMGPNGKAIRRPNRKLTELPNALAVRLNGEDKYIVFNQENDRARRMGESLSNLDAPRLEGALGVVGQATRYFASINTQYNPIFGIVNLVRDTQGALLNLTSTKIAGKQAQVAKGILPAIKAIYQTSRANRSGGIVNGEWADLYERFQNTGGQTGFRDMFSTPKERTEKQLKEALDPSAAQRLYSNTAKPLFDWLSDYNETLENGVRLSAFKAALDSGLSDEQAASLAKELTVNFNRKGQIGTQMGAVYAFFNASTQGTARMLEALKGPKGKQIIAGGMLLGAAQTILLGMAGFDDEDPPEFVREKNLIFPTGDGKYITVPMPLGLHVLPNVGRIIAEQLMGRTQKGVTESVAGLFNVVVDSFNPVGSSTLMQTMAPTVLDPLVALSENTDFTGRNIAREDFNPSKPTPGYTRTKANSIESLVAVSRALNYLSGGSDYTKGLISPTPDQIEYVLSQITGGVGREISKIVQVGETSVTGEELPPYKVPLLGRFYGNTTSQSSQAGQFYENLRAMNDHKLEIKGRLEDGLSTMDYIKENPEAMIFRQAESVERRIQELRRTKQKLKDNGAGPESIRQVEEAITRVMSGFNERVKQLRGVEA